MAHDTMMRAIHFEGVKYFILMGSTHVGSGIDEGDSRYVGREFEDHIWDEKDRDDKVVPIALQVECFDQGFPLFVVVQCPTSLSMRPSTEIYARTDALPRLVLSLHDGQPGRIRDGVALTDSSRGMRR